LPPALGTWRPAGDRAYYLGRTPARLGVGRAGTRCRTGTVLDALADHAAARDAVASALEPEVLRRHGVALLRSAAADRGEFLRRPDLGRRLSAEAAEKVRRHGLRAPQVQIVAADGLSATAINVNLPLVLPPLAAELGRGGVRLGTPFAISLGRVVCADEVARLTEAEVLCLLVGERPGLRTAQSMGAYITYMKVKQFNEAMRVVISNIHEGGLPPAEAAQQIAQTCRQALAEKRTGVEA
jgi:ethanolamine ammonia-lyase small subunit